MRLAVWLGVGLALASLGWQASAANLSPCRVEGVSHEVLCGQVQRPLDPTQPQGTQISVHYVVVPALARHKRPDPVFFLAGGPGQSAISLAGPVMPLLSRLRNRRDIVWVDQRGTGRSAPLVCEDDRAPSLAEAGDVNRQLTQLTACRKRLQALPHGDLRHYTTPVAMQDLDAVRQALGAERINVVGVSYGTRAGLEYLRQFPQAVRRLVLDGVAPADMALPLSHTLDGQTALEAMFLACEREAACAQAHPDLRVRWAEWLAQLPKSVTVVHPLSGQAERFTLTRTTALNAVRSALYSPVTAQALPVAMHEAVQGRPQALLTLGTSLSARKSTAIATGMHFSVVCSEDLARVNTAGDAEPDSVALYRRACADWPRGTLPQGFYAVPRSASPSLLLSGGLDPATPPRHGARVAQALGDRARHVVVPNAGHGVLSLGCMPELLTRFIDTETDDDALSIDTRCVEQIPRPAAFQPVRLDGAVR